LAFQTGYLTGRESRIWDLRRWNNSQSEIGRKLGVSRQAVHRALQIIDSKVERALTEVADINKLEVRSLSLVDGIMEAYSPAYRVPVIVSFSRANGLKVWYLYEGNCSECGNEKTCRRMLEAEAEERGIELSGADGNPSPSQLALMIFSGFMEAS